jgi:hypothetical protein
MLLVLICGGTIGTQIKSSLTMGELLGITQEEYVLSERIDFGDDIINYFGEPNNYSSKLYYELDRAQLREWNYPEPIFFYIVLIILIVSGYLLFKNIARFKYKSFKITISCLFILLFMYSLLIWSDPISLFNQVILRLRGFHM